MSSNNFVLASSAFENWGANLKSGDKPKLFPIGNHEFGHIEIGPGLITLLGGPPGAGKTAFTMQWVFTALELTPSLKAVVCNVEMSPETLFERQLARLSGIDIETIRYRNFTEEHTERLEVAIPQMAAIMPRLCFVKTPFSLKNINDTLIEFTGNEEGDKLLVIDYIQRVTPPGKHGEKRSSVDACMEMLRQIANERIAVIAVSAVGRQKDKRGQSSYDTDTMNLASYRESSELEFGCDDAFILCAGKDKQRRTLKHLKARNTEANDIELMFDGAHQLFTAI